LTRCSHLDCRAAFIAKRAKAHELAEALAGFLEEVDHLDPDFIDWGHVGSMGKAITDLEAVCQFLGVTAD
jgi:hypothetical protein